MEVAEEDMEVQEETVCLGVSQKQDKESRQLLPAPYHCTQSQGNTLKKMGYI